MADGRSLQVIDGDHALGQGVREVSGGKRATIDVRSSEESVRCSLSRVCRIVVWVEDVLNRVAIAGDPSLVVEAPRVPKNVLQQEAIRARRDSVYSVVRAHDAPDLRVPDACLERGQVVL